MSSFHANDSRFYAVARFFDHESGDTMKEVWQLARSAILLLIGIALCEDMCLWPAPSLLQYPSLAALSLSTFAIFVFLAAVPLGCFYAVRSVWRWRDRRAAVSDFLYAGVCLLFAIGYVGNSIWGSTRRTAAFARASTNGAPIIAALEQYHADHGNYPNSLQGLIPEYATSFPRTGLIGYPEFTYLNGYNDIEVVSDSYELRINCSSGGINFDRFVYWPSETYPPIIQGNWTEPIGTWVYVHE